jgi:predicted RNA binding protein YcfA (HicA-like mRNA interferase family)
VPVLKLSKQVWNQLKAKTCDDLIAALRRDRFEHEGTRGAIQGYRHEDGRRVTIHYHPNKCYGPNLLKGLIEDIGWSEADMRRLKLVK